MSEKRQFDVFLCHNSNDKTEVKEIAFKLKELGLIPWLDEEELVPGTRWLKLLQEEIVQVHSAAIFFGGHGIGRVQEHEIEILLNESMERDFSLIPVLLKGSANKPEVSPILKVRGWVDFHEPEPIKKLFLGITRKSIDTYLQELGTKKKSLEQRLREVEIEIGKVTDLLSRDIDPSLNAVLDWLRGREELAKKYGDLALIKNPGLKKKLKERNEIKLFYIEIDSCLELVFYALLKNDESLLYEPGIPMLLADENYHVSISEIYNVYRNVFDMLKRDIPTFEKLSKYKLEFCIDQLVDRFLVKI